MLVVRLQHIPLIPILYMYVCMYVYIYIYIYIYTKILKPCSKNGALCVAGFGLNVLASDLQFADFGA